MESGKKDKLVGDPYGMGAASHRGVETVFGVLRVVGRWVGVMQREVWFFGRVFGRGDGHKPHRKVAGKGNARVI